MPCTVIANVYLNEFSREQFRVFHTFFHFSCNSTSKFVFCLFYLICSPHRIKIIHNYFEIILQTNREKNMNFLFIFLANISMNFPLENENCCLLMLALNVIVG